ncbi:DUF481 domain-containing protein [Pseudomaricurvus alkylphenolicus]|jgi:putative salt-induced outer membrane protein YdiY|uniref:DUF481 domain-containing protein n=1 Tax=Pseudomaricurvus alkylphenolicus TaxID=1306991 RepID=UPI001421E5D1|nr:DUF481 domain-containing protein [Pseudomaricurvus alkylphenolicus]NIB40009.1 DUF481 domain-containing protein [Pseudomaricurvus alkylphenolicus]
MKLNYLSRLVWGAGTLFLSQCVFADELVLNNGDRIQGKLVRMDQKSLVWQSDNFGSLTIDKTKIADLAITEAVKIQGQEESCQVTGVSNHSLSYVCGDRSREMRTELLALDKVEPFSTFQANGHIYEGKMALAGTFSRGNKIEEDLDLDASVKYRHGDFRHVMALDVDSKSVNDEAAVEDYEARYRLDWFFQERWFWYNELRVSMEESKNIDERYLYGTGVGVQMWEYPDTALALESGFDYVKELLDPTDTDLADPSWESSQERAAWRFATDFRYKLPFNAELVNTNEFLYSFEASDDWEFSADLGLSMPLGPGLFSEYKIEYDYDNFPPTEASKEDTKVTVGIGYEW